MAIFLLAIPTLILEVSIGQAYRGGTVIAFNNVHRRMKGTGLASMLVSATGETYRMGHLRNTLTPIQWLSISPLFWCTS